MRTAERVVLLALGNTICGDDGLGAVALQLLQERGLLPPGVQALDGASSSFWDWSLRRQRWASPYRPPSGAASHS